MTTLLLGACADPADEDGGVDAGAADGAAADTGAQGQPDAAPDGGSDANFDAGPDGAVPDAGAVDAAVGDGGMEICSDPARFDGVVYDLYGSAVFGPTEANPTTLTKIDEGGPASSVLVARVRADRGYAWHSQISALTTFASLNLEATLVDPFDGAVYALVRAQIRDVTALRFHSADGSVAREFTPGGATGSDLVGQPNQSNEFVVKYNADGAIQWVRRFGPNGNGTMGSHSLALGRVGDRVRVTAQADGNGPLVFGPGESNELIHSNPGGIGYWFELNAADGNYVANSARFVEGDATTSASNEAVASVGTTATGETPLAGRIVLARAGSPQSITMGLGGTEVILTSTRSGAYFGKLGSDGEPVFAHLAVGLDSNGYLTPTAAAIAPNGDLIAGGKQSVLANRIRFEGTGGQQVVDIPANNGFLVSYTSTGELRWVRQIKSQAPYPVNRIIARDDGVYVVGNGTYPDVLGLGEPNELPLRSPGGWYLAKFSSDTGELLWARVFGQATGLSSSLYEAWSTGSELTLSNNTNGFFYYGGPAEKTVSAPGGMITLSSIRLSTDGAYLGCQAMAVGPRFFRAD